MTLSAHAWSVGVIGVAMGIAVAAHGVGAGEEKVIALDDVPEQILALARLKLEDARILAANTQTEPDVAAEVLEAARVKLAGARLVSANTETELDGSFVYEIQAVLHDGRKVEFDIFPDQSIEEIEVEFRADQVPGAVKKAIESKVPGFVPRFIEASHSGTFKVVGYEFVGRLGETEMDLEVSADGRRIEVADR